MAHRPVYPTCSPRPKLGIWPGGPLREARDPSLPAESAPIAMPCSLRASPCPPPPFACFRFSMVLAGPAPMLLVPAVCVCCRGVSNGSSCFFDLACADQPRLGTASLFVYTLPGPKRLLHQSLCRTSRKLACCWAWLNNLPPKPLPEGSLADYNLPPKPPPEGSQTVCFGGALLRSGRPRRPAKEGGRSAQAQLQGRAASGRGMGE